MDKVELMKMGKRVLLLIVALCYALPTSHASTADGRTQLSIRRAPELGADTVYADWPHILIEGWRDKEKGDQMAGALKAAGVRSIRFNFAGIYSPRGPEASAKVKAENKMRNEYPWFPFDDYADYIAAHDFNTVVGINVEEGPDVAAGVVREFIERNILSKLVAVELSNEPWLNHRPWLPEEFATRAADVIERLTPLGVRFALPLTVGKGKNTPTKLSDSEWNSRMLKALSARVDLKNRSDVYGVLHLYARGMRAKSIEYFNKEVRPFAPNMRYLVTEFNIRLGLEGNPHLTNKYALEFARKLAEVMAEPQIEAMYVHAVPYHSIVYWSNGRKIITVIGHRDPKLTGQGTAPGWHTTPAGKVYALYSKIAWNGEVITYRKGDGQSYWAVKASDGRLVVTLLNDSDKTAKKKVQVQGREVTLGAPARSIVCYDLQGNEIERLSLRKDEG